MPKTCTVINNCVDDLCKSCRSRWLKKKIAIPANGSGSCINSEGKCQGEAKVTVGLIITRHLFGVWVQRWDIK